MFEQIKRIIRLEAEGVLSAEDAEAALFCLEWLASWRLGLPQPERAARAA